MSAPDRPEPDVNAEFEAFKEEFLDHLLPEGMSEAERQMWRDLR